MQERAREERKSGTSPVGSQFSPNYSSNFHLCRTQSLGVLESRQVEGRKEAAGVGSRTRDPPQRQLHLGWTCKKIFCSPGDPPFPSPLSPWGASTDPGHLASSLVLPGRGGGGAAYFHLDLKAGPPHISESWGGKKKKKLESSGGLPNPIGVTPKVQVAREIQIQPRVIIWGGWGSEPQLGRASLEPCMQAQTETECMQNPRAKNR